MGGGEYKRGRELPPVFRAGVRGTALCGSYSLPHQNILLRDGGGVDRLLQRLPFQSRYGRSGRGIQSIGGDRFVADLFHRHGGSAGDEFFSVNSGNKNKKTGRTRDQNV